MGRAAAPRARMTRLRISARRDLLSHKSDFPSSSEGRYQLLQSTLLGRLNAYQWAERTALVRRCRDARSGTFNRFCAFYLRDGLLARALAVNRPRDVRAATRLIERHARVDPAQLVDEDVDLRKVGTVLRG